MQFIFIFPPPFPIFSFLFNNINQHKRTTFAFFTHTIIFCCHKSLCRHFSRKHTHTNKHTHTWKIRYLFYAHFCSATHEKWQIFVYPFFLPFLTYSTYSHHLDSFCYFISFILTLFCCCWFFACVKVDTINLNSVLMYVCHAYRYRTQFPTKKNFLISTELRMHHFAPYDSFKIRTMTDSQIVCWQKHMKKCANG